MKYIGRSAVNELTRRGVKGLKAITYKELVSRLRSAEGNIRSGDSDVLTLKRTAQFEAMVSSKDKYEQRKFLKYITDMHDKHKLNFREIVLTLNEVEYNKETSRPERQRAIVESLVKRSGNYIKNETRYASPKDKPKTLKGLRTAATYNSMKILSKTPLSLGVHKARLLKSLEYYPYHYKQLILAQIERLGDSWLLQTMNKNLPLLDLVLSSDRDILENAGEFSIQDYFELEPTTKVDPEMKFRTTNLTGEEFNALIDRYVF